MGNSTRILQIVWTCETVIRVGKLLPSPNGLIGKRIGKWKRLMLHERSDDSMNTMLWIFCSDDPSTVSCTSIEIWRSRSVAHGWRICGTSSIPRVSNIRNPKDWISSFASTKETNNYENVWIMKYVNYQPIIPQTFPKNYWQHMHTHTHSLL